MVAKETGGQTLRRLRLEHRLSQNEVALMLGVKRAAVGHWERGWQAPPQLTRKMIALWIGVPLDAYWESNRPSKQQIAAQAVAR